MKSSARCPFNIVRLQTAVKHCAAKGGSQPDLFAYCSLILWIQIARAAAGELWKKTHLGFCIMFFVGCEDSYNINF